MNRFLFLLLPFLYLLAPTLSAQGTLRTLHSPGKLSSISIGLNKSGEPFYKINYRGKTAVDWSRLGFDTKEYKLHSGFSLRSASTSTHDDTWTPVWGEVAQIRDHYNELEYRLSDATGCTFIIRCRAYDEGVGFRYELPRQDCTPTVTITDERTEFQMTGDHTAWWIPGDYDSNEHVYSTTAISAIDNVWYNREHAISTQHIVKMKNVQTPITMKTADGTHIALAEAALADFGALHLETDVKNLKFKAFLIPSADSTVKSVNTMPFHSPWRAVLLSKDAAGILRSKLILNLNEPCKIKDVSWIKPQKYVGVWWEMHVGLATWDYEATADMMAATGREVKNGRHGANTANVKRYIDFASKYGFDGVLVEGWNLGWKDWFGKWKDEVFDFAKPYPDFDMDELSRYAKEKGVKIIAHHETSSAVPSYERQMDAAYAYMNKYGQNAVKTGYVGKIIPKGEWHDGQWMNNHYLRVAERTAQNRIMVDMHEPVRPSGWHRSWPNWMACEAARGQEFNAWSTGNPPEHECILPFTRILGGPMDYTPGIFEVRMSAYDPNKKEVVHTTVAKQLALYVTLYSPLQMAADLPENYEKRLDVFQFIRDVPVDWDDTRILDAAVGDYISTARRQKGTHNWFVGSITDENPRNTTLKLDFLPAGKTYEATIYADGAGAHWESNPYPVSISKRKVRKGDTLSLQLAAGGGAAVSLIAQ
ncbi:MAG: glycoside hydrolase family 97 protein [Saprospiraceae bacterium]|nr:glycoside hydrolase family 97 protein [Saprospiraceae bacterium]